MAEGKAQVTEKKVECLGCILTEGLWYVGSEGVQIILELLLARTKGEL